MKLALIGVNAKYIHSNLAIYDLAAYVNKDYGDSVEIYEYTINQPTEQILRGLYEIQADAYFFSCYLWNIDIIKNLAVDLKKIMPKANVWLGGPEVSYNALDVLEECSAVDGIICGEGEETFLELCNYYAEGAPGGGLENISGIAYNGILTPQRQPMDLSRVPFCYEVLSDLNLSHRIVYYESSRGCPFNCSYCLSSIDKKVRFRSLEQVFHELSFFIDNDVPQVKFVDRTFNCDHERTMAIWKYMMDHDNGRINFHCEVAAELLTDEEIELINKMRPGLIQLEIGVQTTNSHTLKEIHRPSEYERLKDIVNKIHKNHNIHCHLDLIAGLPYEDISSFRDSYNDVYALLPDQLQLGFLKLLKGSYMDLHHEEYECVVTEQAPFEVLKTKWVSYEDILKLKWVEEMTEVYYNSGQFTFTVPYLLKYYSTPYDFYFSIGEYYHEKGYLDISHNRVKRYEILLEYVMEKLEAVDMDYLKECLKMDLFLRENLKSRPDWLDDIYAVKGAIKDVARDKGISLDKLHHIERFTKIYDKETFVYYDYTEKEPLSNNCIVNVL